jgi:hypothetical protein
LGVVEFLASPFVAAYGAISASHRLLSPSQLSESESDLVQAMRLMADQKCLSQLLPETARSQDRWRVVPLTPTANRDAAQQPVGAVLKVQVDKLQLQRLDKSDGSYVLRIAARARLLGTSDGSVLCDRTYEYRSGRAMFIDWASLGGFQNAAETGYRSLADQIAGDLLPPAADQPLVLGAGFANTRARPAAAKLARWQSPWPDTAARVQAVAAFAGSIEVYADHDRPNLILQRPLTRQEAVADAVDQNGWALDGLQDDRNSVVQAVAQVAAVPGGIWKQIVAVVRGRSERRVHAEEQQLLAAAVIGKPTVLLANQVAQQLAPNTSQPVLLAVDPSPYDPAAPPNLVLYPTGRPKPELVQTRFRTPPPGTALEIHVLNAELSGKEGINPPLALRFEAKATLYRTADGRQLYSCPVFYRSTERPFKVWASAKGQLFYDELSRAYADMGNAIARQLLSQGVVAPVGTSPAATVVEN